ncbi:hypothetical protein J7L48_06930 [bacterium]|nr:hypothetical protein [bacterium]
MNFFMTERMYHYLIACKNEDLYKIAPDILKNGSLHIEVKKEMDFTKLDEMEKQLGVLENEINNDPEISQKIISYDRLQKDLAHYYNRFQKYREFLGRLKLRMNLIKYFSAFFELNPSTPDILGLPHLFFIVKKDRKTLSIEYLEKYETLWTNEDFREYSVFFAIYDEENKRKVLEKIITEIEGAHFNDVVKLGKAQKPFEILEEKKWALLDTEREKTLEFNHFKEEISQNLGLYKNNINFYKKVTQFQSAVLEKEYISIISGWVPKSKTEDFEGVLNKGNINYTKEIEEYGNVNVPVKFSRNKILDPFNGLVKQYGTTRYGFINPVLFFTFFFLIFFGFMFADFGHGSIIFLLGVLLLFSPNYKGAAPLVLLLGISAMLFGFFFGDFFGKEGIIKPLFFSAEHNFMKIIAISIMLGIGVNITGNILNIIQYHYSKDYFNMFFGEWGVLTLIYYLSLLILPALSIAKIIPSKIMLYLLLGIIIAGIIVKFYFTTKKHGKDEAITDTLIISTWFIEFLSHSMSFIRVAAFLLAHIALTSASYMIIEGTKMKGFSAILLLISWTLFVIILEGIVVFIQSLRLNFYEFFSKFFTGDGKDYDPIKL